MSTRTGLGLVGIALVIVGAIVGAIALQPSPASAHALLVRSDPPINASLRESPRAIDLVMSEPLQRDFSSVDVLDAQGQRVGIGDTTFNDADATNMRRAVPRLPAGIYTVVWETLSEVDGHTWNGSYSFTVLNEDGSAPVGAAFAPDLSRPGPSTGLDAGIRWFTLTAGIALIGALLFAQFAGRPAARLTPPHGGAHGGAHGDADGDGDGGGDHEGDHDGGRLRRVLDDRMWDIAALSLAVILITTLYDAASAALSLGGLEFLDEVLFDTRNGSWLIGRWVTTLVGAAIVVAGYRRPALRGSPQPTYALLAVGATLIATLSSVSHGAAIDQGDIWGALFDAVHFAAAAIWIGMLGALLITLWAVRSVGSAVGRQAWRIEAVRRFSWFAAAAVPVLILAGVMGTLTQVPAWRGFTDTDWGIAWLIKMAIVLAVLAAAGANALLLRPRTEAAGTDAVGTDAVGTDAVGTDAVGTGGHASLERRFRWLMRVELGLALAVIGATAALTQLSSPRSELPELLAAPQKDRAIEETLLLDDLVGRLRVEPNLVGANRYAIDLRAADGGVIDDPVTAVRFRFRFADPAVGPVTVPAESEGDGRYALEGAFFGLPGDWTIDVEVRRATRDDAVASAMTSVEQGFINILPFATDRPGSLALPISQFDWNGIAALWSALAAMLLIAYRPTLRDRLSDRAGDAALAGGTLCMAATFVLAFGIHVEPGRTLQNPIAGDPVSVERGEVLFAANCTQCHGTTGEGDGPLATSLPTPPANFRVHVPFHPDGVLFAWVSDGIRGTGMPAFADDLSEQDRWDLINFLRTNFDTPLGRSPAEDADPATDSDSTDSDAAAVRGS